MLQTAFLSCAICGYGYAGTLTMTATVTSLNGCFNQTTTSTIQTITGNDAVIVSPESSCGIGTEAQADAGINPGGWDRIVSGGGVVDPNGPNLSAKATTDSTFSFSVPGLPGSA